MYLKSIIARGKDDCRVGLLRAIVSPTVETKGNDKREALCAEDTCSWERSAEERRSAFQTANVKYVTVEGAQLLAAMPGYLSFVTFVESRLVAPCKKREEKREERREKKETRKEGMRGLDERRG